MANNLPPNPPSAITPQNWDAILGVLAMLAVKQNCNCVVCKLLNNIINKQLENITKLLLEGEKSGES
ncbi:MAG: hypothetical protein QW228_08595 [Candidatus Aenigmatarchaeota archaeon]